MQMEGMFPVFLCRKLHKKNEEVYLEWGTRVLESNITPVQGTR